MILQVKAIKDCKDDNKDVIFKKDETGMVHSFVPFLPGETHAVIVKHDNTIITVDIKKLKAL